MRFLDLPVGAVFILPVATRGYKYVKVNAECASYKHLAYKCRINTYCLDSNHCIVLSYKAECEQVDTMDTESEEYKKIVNLCEVRDYENGVIR